jgi:hypothetical protein
VRHFYAALQTRDLASGKPHAGRQIPRLRRTAKALRRARDDGVYCLVKD